MPTFQTAEGKPPVEITGVGVADQHGIELERAAMSMSELQKPELDENDEPTGNRVPLEGPDLLAAAKEWAARAGLIVVDDEAPVSVPPISKGTGASAAASIPAVVPTPADPGVNAPPLEA